MRAGPLVIIVFAGSVAAASAAAPRAPDLAERTAASQRFELRQTRIAPKRPLFDGRKRIRLHYGFAAAGPTDLEIRVVHAKSGRTVRVWRQARMKPGARHRRAWNGLNRRGSPVPDGRYRFKVGPGGRRLHGAGTLRLRGHVFPVDGPHADRGSAGEFGAPRNGGRIHEGFDINADCGTPLVAVRGGRVAEAGFHARLYGYFARINARKSDQQYFYSHLIAPARVRTGDRVRTGERLGEVGQTGNAGSTPCHLHFELREDGGLVDPKPALRSWER